MLKRSEAHLALLPKREEAGPFGRCCDQRGRAQEAAVLTPVREEWITLIKRGTKTLGRR
jgi:hypothetical protein